MRACIVCSNDTQVRMFVPVTTALRARGATVEMLSLDSFYAQRATETARALGLEAVELTGSEKPPRGRGFYARPVVEIWREVIAARPEVDRILEQMAPGRLVLGNDYGLIEKLILARSFARSVERRILVQDGRLARRRPGSAGLAGRGIRLAKQVLSPPLRWAGAGYLAASDYGEGGAEVICASGPRSSRLLARRSRGNARIVVTGQPRYDRLASMVRDRMTGELRTVAVCTTPFAAAGLGSEPQERQLDMVRGLRDALAPRGIALVVKPHPRESPAEYAQIVGDENVRTGDAAAVLAVADVAVIGFSTLLEEAAILGCPVLTPGEFLHGARFEALLPDAAAFQPFRSIAELTAAALQLTDGDQRIQLAARQRDAVSEEVAFSPDHPAADLVADAIMAP